jgi:hypothetical protein
MQAPLPPPERKERPYAEELVYTTAEDGVTLDGAIIRPRIPLSRDEEPWPPPARDIAVVWMHGLTSSFYNHAAVGIGRELAARGFTFITGNNRGHDFGFVLRRAPGGRIALGGGGWERFSESPYDVGAWVTFTTNLGFRGVILAGHSLGALKVGYYQALRQDDRVLGIVAASPPVAASWVDPAHLALAQRLVADGRGEELLPWGSSPAGAGRFSAGTYLDRADTGLDIYGLYIPPTGGPDTPPARGVDISPAGRADIPPAGGLDTPPARADRAEERVTQASGATLPLTGTHLVSRIRCPIFACYGTDEASVGGAAELDAVRRAATAASGVETYLIPGADHSYAGHQATVAATLAEWIASLATLPAVAPAPST